MKHVLMNGEASFLVEAFELASFSLKLSEFRCKPGCRVSEGDSPCFLRSQRIQKIMESSVIMEKQFFRSGQVVDGGEISNASMQGS